MKQLRKPTRLPAWKQWLIVVLVFALGVLIGRLLINQWQLVAGVLIVGLALAALVLSERKKG
jgi:protein-S-isoprenylcysteine O-methyltransferase Ste14